MKPNPYYDARLRTTERTYTNPWLLVVIGLLALFLVIESALAIDLDPRGDINMRGQYNIKNGANISTNQTVNVTGQVCLGGTCRSSWPTSDNSSFNQTLTDARYLAVGDQRYNDTSLVSSVGNWTADKTSYNTITQANAKYVQNSTCIEGEVMQNSTTSGAQCIAVLSSVPYQSSAAGWANNSQNITTGLNVQLTGTNAISFEDPGENISSATTGEVTVNARGYSMFKLDTNTNGADTDDAFVVNIAGSTRFNIDRGGWVGIGTTQPTSKVQIANGNLTIGNGNHTGLILNPDSGAAGTTFIDFEGSRGLIRYNGSAQHLEVLTGSAKNLILGTGHNGVAGDIKFVSGTSATPLVTINGSGSVGIGTQSPTAALDVRGTTQLFGSFYMNSTVPGPVFRVLPFQGTPYGGIMNPVFVGTTTSDPLIFRTADADRLTINETGSVGIGTTAPTAALDVRSSSATHISIATVGCSGQTARLLDMRDSAKNLVFGVTPGGSIDTYRVVADNTASSLNFRKAGDSGGSSNAVGSSSVLGAVTFGGYNGSTYNQGAYIQALPTHTYNSTGAGTKITITTTPVNSLTNQAVAEFRTYAGSTTNFFNVAGGGTTATAVGGGISHTQIDYAGLAFIKDPNSQSTVLYGYNSGDEGILRVAARSYSATAKSDEWNANTSTKLFVTASGRVGVNQGSITPVGMLDVQTLGATTVGVVVKAAAAQTSSLIEARDSGGVARMSVGANGNIITRYGGATNSGNSIVFNKIGNTSGASNAVATDAELGWIGFYGSNGSSFNRGAYIIAQAMQPFTSTAAGTNIFFHTAPSGSLTTNQAMLLSHAGQLTVYGSTGYDADISSDAVGTRGAAFRLNTESDGYAALYYRNSSEADMWVVGANSGYAGGNMNIQDFNFINVPLNRSVMTFDRTGEVGIMTRTPTQTLDVNGSMNISGVNGRLYLPGGGYITGNSTAIIIQAP